MGRGPPRYLANVLTTANMWPSLQPSLTFLLSFRVRQLQWLVFSYLLACSILFSVARVLARPSSGGRGCHRMSGSHPNRILPRHLVPHPSSGVPSRRSPALTLCRCMGCRLTGPTTPRPCPSKISAEKLRDARMLFGPLCTAPDLVITYLDYICLFSILPHNRAANLSRYLEIGRASCRERV